MLIEKSKNYLSEVMEFLPSNVLIDKGMVGCGGTTLELTCPRNSIVLVPTRNLVENKAKENILGVTGMTSNEEIESYLTSSLEYKKIVGTYDCLPRLLNYNLTDYFLLIDEYHLLFYQYKFRNKAITFLLDNFRLFKNWAFLTATSLSEYTILEELKGIPIIRYEWEGKAKLEITFSPTASPIKVAEDRINHCLLNNYNLHIFLNSFKTIKKIVNDFNKLDYRVICSPNQKDKSDLNFQSVNSKARKINFYTCTAYEGVDIFDTMGKTIVLSDDRLSTTMMDISVSIPQIAGRLRDSQFLNQIEYIYNSTKHRYLGKNDLEWETFKFENKRDGNAAVSLFHKGDDLEKKVCVRRFNPDFDFGLYINCDGTELYHDPNLVRCDDSNYRIFQNLSNLYTQKPKIVSKVTNFLAKWKSEIEEQAYKFLIKGHEYTKPELEELFFAYQLIAKPKFEPSFVSDNFENFQSYRKTIRGKKYTVYKFY